MGHTLQVACLVWGGCEETCGDENFGCRVVVWVWLLLGAAEKQTLQ